MKKFSYMVPIGYVLYGLAYAVGWVIAFFVALGKFVEKNPSIPENQRLNEFGKQIIQGNTVLYVVLAITTVIYIVLWLMVLIQAARLDRKTALILYIVGFFVHICGFIGFFVHLSEIRNTNKRIQSQG